MIIQRGTLAEKLIEREVKSMIFGGPYEFEAMIKVIVF
jgi:hypothetical protein